MKLHGVPKIGNRELALAEGSSKGVVSALPLTQESGRTQETKAFSAQETGILEVY